MRMRYFGLLGAALSAAASPQASPAFGESIAAAGSVLAVGDPLHDAGTNRRDTGRVLLYAVTPQAAQRVAHRTPTGAEAGDRFGTLVGLDDKGGSMLLGGAGSRPKGTYFYEFAGSSGWSEWAYRIPSGAIPQVHCDQVAFGADFAAARCDHHVAIYDRHLGGVSVWGERTQPGILPLADYDYGDGLAAHGDHLAIGVRCLRLVNDDCKGAVHLHSRNQGGTNQWGLVTAIAEPSDSPADFGTLLSLRGDTLVVGQQREGLQQWPARVYRLRNNRWDAWTALPPHPTVRQDFGMAVTVGTGFIAVAGRGTLQDLPAESTNIVLYELAGNNWVYKQTLRVSAASRVRLASNGTLLFVATVGGERGVVSAFGKVGSDWQQRWEINGSE